MSVGAELGSALIRKILKTARQHLEATGEPAVAVYVHPVDLENLKAWSQENLWYIVNDDSGKWEIDGVPLKTSLVLSRGEVRVE